MAEHASVQGRKRTMWYERDNPEQGYPSGAGGFQNHHILPCTSVKTSLIEAAKSKDNLIKGVKYFSVWNINKGANMTMLPTVPVYQKLFGKKGGKQGPIPVPPNLLGKPCHDRRHNVYNDKAKTALNSVWAKVVITLEDHKLTDATDIGGDLDTKMGIWKGKVSGRGTTLAKWRAMCAGDEDATKVFAMATED